MLSRNWSHISQPWLRRRDSAAWHQDTVSSRPSPQLLCSIISCNLQDKSIERNKAIIGVYACWWVHFISLRHIHVLTQTHTHLTAVFTAVPYWTEFIGALDSDAALVDCRSADSDNLHNAMPSVRSITKLLASIAGNRYFSLMIAWYTGSNAPGKRKQERSWKKRS